MVTLLMLLISLSSLMAMMLASLMFAEITIGMDRYFIVPDCVLYIIYILTYLCIVRVIFVRGRRGYLHCLHHKTCCIQKFHQKQFLL